jgi:hypothetical protein
VSSIDGMTTKSHLVAYSATMALRGKPGSPRSSSGKYGVRVNAVARSNQREHVQVCAEGVDPEVAASFAAHPQDADKRSLAEKMDDVARADRVPRREAAPAERRLLVDGGTGRRASSSQAPEARASRQAERRSVVGRAGFGAVAEGQR